MTEILKRLNKRLKGGSVGFADNHWLFYDKLGNLTHREEMQDEDLTDEFGYTILWMQEYINGGQ